MEGFGSGAGSGSVKINYGSGCGSRRSKKIGTEHCMKVTKIFLKQVKPKQNLI
jgi:hypothetical protein